MSPQKPRQMEIFLLAPHRESRSFARIEGNKMSDRAADALSGVAFIVIAVIVVFIWRYL